MENQTNVGNQKTQQIEQNPINQPVLTPEKSKINYLGMIGVILICFVVFGFGGYYLEKQSSQSQKYVNDGQNQVSPTTTPQVNNPTPTTIPNPTLDPTANWKTYTNNTLGISFKIPENWSNFSMNNFSSQPFTNTEESLYLGPKNTSNKPPQVMQVTSYKKGSYQEQEVFPEASCTTTTVSVGVKPIQAEHKICKGMETNGFITVKTNQFIFIIDELKVSAMDHELFNQILSTFKFIN